MLRRALKMLPACLAAVAFTPGVGADIYKYVDETGGVHLSDRRLTPQYKLLVRTKRKQSSTGARNYELNRRRYAGLIDDTARRYRLDNALVHAVVRTESAYDAAAVSHAGAVGLMQLMPGTARRYGVSDRRDPAQNVAGGVRYLRDLLRRFGNLKLALAAYNAGESAVIQHGNRIPPYRETQDYVRKVLGHYQRLRKPS